MNTERLTTYGWPMRHAPVTFNDGTTKDELCVFCPSCDGRYIRMDSMPAGAGTGARGGHRLGDNFRPRVTCLSCGHQYVGPVNYWDRSGNIRQA